MHISGVGFDVILFHAVEYVSYFTNMAVMVWCAQMSTVDEHVAVDYLGMLADIIRKFSALAHNLQPSRTVHIGYTTPHY